MRPNLLEVPGAYLYVAALIVAAAAFALNLVQRRRDPKARWSSTPVVLVVAASVLCKWAAGEWLPLGDALLHEWKRVPIYSYGVMLGTSLLVGWFLAMKLARNDGIDSQAAGAIYMWTAIASIIGARLLYILTNLDEFTSLTQVFMLNQGGLVAYGGMIGGFLGSVIMCWRRKVQLLRWADAAAPSVVLGTAITRVGCLLYGCDFGARSDVPWAITFPKPAPAWSHHVHDLQLPETALRSFPVHPTQIYESLVGLALFGLMMMVRRFRRFSGLVFLTWVTGYGLLRPVIEIYRDDDQRGNVGPLSTSQFIGLATLALGLGFLVVLVRRYRANPAALRLWEAAPVGQARAVQSPAPAQPSVRSGRKGHRRR